MPNNSRFHTATLVGTLAMIFLIALTIGLSIGFGDSQMSQRSFSVDHVNNTFLKDGEPFRYVSGSFHYFRALPGAWRDRLRTMRAAGLNAIDTYVEWSFHNPLDGVYNWEKDADVEHFIELAQKEGFNVILRPGPYICAERDNGGLPHWLFNKYPNIRLRTSDANYTYEISRWYAELMPRMRPYLYGNGGPIIMVQVENEYGVFEACDKVYLNWLRDETERYVEGKALLFTTDIPNEHIACGKIEGVFATTDFGIDRIHEIDEIWRLLRSVQPTGPLVNSEFYPGWLTHWQEENQRRDAQEVATALRTILSYGASVNVYMFFGGSNFGFTAGANDWGYGNYTPDITSYDYDAVMDEAGDTTVKYDKMRQVIAEYLTLPTELPATRAAPKKSYGTVALQPLLTLLSAAGRQWLSGGSAVTAAEPQSFEQLNLNSGLVLYETQLPPLEIDPTLLRVQQLHDRALVYVDNYWVGTLSRENQIDSMPLNKGLGARLQLLVENQGRINFNVANDRKGLLGAITVQQLSGAQLPLTNWTSQPYDLAGHKLQTLLEKHKTGEVEADTLVALSAATRNLRHGPTLFYGQFTVDGAQSLADTYLRTNGWGKGVAYVNGFNLGRYWPLAGPQQTLYVPKEALKVGVNDLLLLEYQRVPAADTTVGGRAVQLVATPSLDGV